MPKKTKLPEPKPAEKLSEEEKLAKAEEEANRKAKAEAEAKAKAEETETPAEGEVETPPSESAPEETETPPAEGEPEPESPEEEKGEPTDEEILAHLKAKGQKRFRQLLADNKNLKGLLEKKYPEPKEPSVEVTEPPAGKPPVSEGFPWDKPSKPEVPREVTPEQYDKEVDTAASKKVQTEVAQWMKNYERAQQIQMDVGLIEGEYPELSPGKRDIVTGKVIEPNPDYNEKLAKEISDLYRGLFKSNPDIRLGLFVRRIMTLRKEGAEKAKGKISATVAKQAAEQALTPTGAPPAKGDLLEMVKSVKTEEDLARVEKLLPHA